MADLFEQYAAPGQMVRVDDRHLHFHVQGVDNNSPSIILESGQAGFSLDWMLVQPEISRFARVCAYDRAGLGWSQPGPRPRTPQQIVSELHAALAATQLPRPYVLIAHSLGARYARLFVQLYPEEVVGLVLVDAYLEGFDTALGEQKLKTFVANRARQYRFLGSLARIGVIRILGSRIISMLGPDFRAMPVHERKRYATLATRPGAMETTIDEYEEAVASHGALQLDPLRENLPLRVLTHGVPWPYPDYERCWQDSQREAVSWSSRSKLLVAEKSGHGIMLAQPELVIDAVRQVVEETRQKS